MLCPNPGHPDSNPSCSVNEDTGFWHCFSCGVGGDLAALGKLALKKPRYEVVNLLKPTSPDALGEMTRNRLARLQATALQRPVSGPSAPPGGPYSAGPLSSLLRRGLTRQTLARWGVRFCDEQVLEGHKGPFTLRAAIAIPIRDENGRLLAWCYRRTDSSPAWQPKYLYSGEVSEFWWGVEHHSRAEEVAVVEGAVDGMSLDQVGIPALAMLGSNMGDRKILRLQNHRQVTLFADCDHAGVTWVRRVGNMIGNRVHLKVVMYPRWVRATDPGALPFVDLEILYSRAIPWQIWLRRSA